MILQSSCTFVLINIYGPRKPFDQILVHLFLYFVLNFMNKLLFRPNILVGWVAIGWGKGGGGRGQGTSVGFQPGKSFPLPCPHPQYSKPCFAYGVGVCGCYGSCLALVSKMCRQKKVNAINKIVFDKDQGPVVQSIVSLTSSLRGLLVKCFKTL